MYLFPFPFHLKLIFSSPSFAKGIGSFLFHATLWYSMQMADELPMTWTALISVYGCLENAPQRRFPLLLPILWIYAVISTLWQLWLTRTMPIIHELQV
jgi:dihydroceramidase